MNRRVRLTSLAPVWLRRGEPPGSARTGLTHRSKLRALPCLFDHLVSAHEKRLGDRKAECFSGFEVDR